MNAVKKTAIVVMCLLFLCGCSRYQSLENLIIVIGTGYDIPENDVEDAMKVTAQIVKSGEEEDGFINVTSTAKTNVQAAEDISLQIGGQAYLQHEAVMVVGEELAQRGAAQVFEGSYSMEGKGSGQYVAICQGKASELLSREKAMTGVPARALNRMFKRVDNEMYYLPITLQEVVQGTAGKSQTALIPYICMDENDEVWVKSMAVLKNYRLKGILTRQEATGALWAGNHIRNGNLEIQMADGSIVSLEMVDCQTNSSMEVRGGTPVMNTSIRISAAISNQTNFEDMLTQQTREELANRTREQILSQINAAFGRAQQWDADMIGAHELLYQLGEETYQKYHDNLLSTMKYEAVIDISFIDYGVKYGNLEETQ